MQALDPFISMLDKLCTNSCYFIGKPTSYIFLMCSLLLNIVIKSLDHITSSQEIAHTILWDIPCRMPEPQILILVPSLKL